MMKYKLAIAALAAVLFVPFLGNAHLFDWDEINFAELSREMLVLDNYLNVHINFQPFWEKPPLFMWLQAAAMQLFGINEFAARLPNAICGVFTLLFIFHIGEKLFNTRFGLLWVGAYLGSILPFLYFKSGIIDPWFNFFIFGGIYFFVLAYWKKDGIKTLSLPRSSWLYFLVSGLFIGFGILTKGPVAFLLIALTLFVYWIFQKFRMYVSVLNVLFFTIVAISVTGLWFGVEVLRNGFWFVEQFVVYQIRLFSTPDAGHGGFFGYHFVVLLVGCFPASIFAIHSFFKMPNNEVAHQRDFVLFMKILFWVVLILFTIVKSKIVHYSSMAYFPLTFLAAYVLDGIIKKEIAWNGWLKFGVLFIGSVFAFATLVTPFLGKNIALLRPLFSKDPFAAANLDAAVTWTGIEIVPSLWLIGVLVFFIFSIKKRPYRALQVLFLGTAVFCVLVLGFFINKIEGYAQNAAISFYESKVNEDCLIYTYGFKSYAHLFYAKKRSTQTEGHVEQIFLKNNAVNSLARVMDIHQFNLLPKTKPTYIVSKIQHADDLRAILWLQELESKNGFVFFKVK